MFMRKISTNNIAYEWILLERIIIKNLTLVIILCIHTTLISQPSILLNASFFIFI